MLASFVLAENDLSGTARRKELKSLLEKRISRKASMIAVLPVLFSPPTANPRGNVTLRSSILRKFCILRSRSHICAFFRSIIHPWPQSALLD